MHSNFNNLTILMPVKQHQPNFLHKSLGSVFDQSCTDWKLLIIVEKGDWKDFQSLLAKPLRHPQVRMVVNEGRRLGGALNTGMRRSKSDFVAILFADDMWAANAVSVLGEAIRQNPKADFFHSSRIIIDETDRPISSVHYSRELFQIADFFDSSPVKHLLSWRRELGLAVGGIDESHNHGPDDYDFPWTMAEAGAVFHAIKEPLYLYRDHRESYRLTTHVPLSSQKWALRRILKKHGIDRDRIRARIAAAESSYLRQCLFGTHEDQRQKTKFGYDSRLGWRDVYR
jgi:glycosyltransferase involved in cell wall biosynthesis